MGTPQERIVGRAVMAKSRQPGNVRLKLSDPTPERRDVADRQLGIVPGLSVNRGPAPTGEPEQRQEHNSRRFACPVVTVDRPNAQPEHPCNPTNRRAPQVVKNGVPDWQCPGGVLDRLEPQRHRRPRSQSTRGMRDDVYYVN